MYLEYATCLGLVHIYLFIYCISCYHVLWRCGPKTKKKKKENDLYNYPIDRNQTINKPKESILLCIGLDKQASMCEGTRRCTSNSVQLSFSYTACLLMNVVPKQLHSYLDIHFWFILNEQARGLRWPEEESLRGFVFLSDTKTHYSSSIAEKVLYLTATLVL